MLTCCESVGRDAALAAGYCCWQGQVLVHLLVRHRRGLFVDGIADVDDRADLSVAVIDGLFERRWIVDVYPTQTRCRTCDEDCEHERAVRRTLEEYGLGPIDDQSNTTTP